MLEPKDQEQDKIQNIVQFPKIKNNGMYERPSAGVKLFEVDYVTKEVIEAVYKSVSLPMEKMSPVDARAKMRMRGGIAMKSEVVRKQLEVKPGKWYVWAINEKNALRKFEKTFK